MTDLALPTIRPITAAGAAEIEAVLDAAFGADRRRRTVYRLRDGVAAIADLSFAAFANGRLIGTLQSWPVALTDSGRAIPLILVGPVAVHPDVQSRGIGHALMDALLKRTSGPAALPMMLIGDAPYYGRFGFAADAERRWTLPGPFERHRLLVRESPDRPLPATGTLRPRHD